MAILSQADAIDWLFLATLDALADVDVFSADSEPTSFVVYAHDADGGDDELGPAYSDIVKTFIAWLRRARSRTLSDQNPEALFGYEARLGTGESACRYILENQFCLLPRVGKADGDGGLPGISTVDTAIVFGTPRLKSYCQHAFANGYLDALRNAYDECTATGRPLGELRQKILTGVWITAARQPGFHHALTELAFLELRHKYTPHSHGIMLVSFDRDIIDYLRSSQPTNLQLNVDATSSGAVLHDRFFKLMRMIHPQQHAAIKEYEAAYKNGRREIESQHNKLSEKDLIILSDKGHSKARRDLVNFQNAEIRNSFQRIRSDQPDSLALARSEKRRNGVLSKLSTIDYRGRKDRNSERVAGTCIWFTNHPKFQEWHIAKSGGLLWVTAYPGCGKSVLLKHLVDTVLVAANTAVCYFFFKDDFEDQKSINSALSCLLHQLFQQRPELLTDEVVRRFEQDQQLLSSTMNLWGLLGDMARVLTEGNIVLVLDALDECLLDDRQVFMRLLVKWSREPVRTALKILVSSRPYNDIRQGFHPLASEIHLSGEHDLAMDQISDEIDLVIADKLHSARVYLNLEPQQQELLRQELAGVKHKTYLWARLVLDEIDRMPEINSKALRETVRRLPQSVDEAYEKILNRGDHRQRPKVMRMLCIIVAAKKPLNLLQLAQAWDLTLDVQSTADLKVISEAQMVQTLNGLCGLFVIVVEKKVYLLHQTAREFLLAPPTITRAEGVLWKGSIIPTEAELAMAKICLQYFRIYDCPSWSFGYWHIGPMILSENRRKGGTCGVGGTETPPALCFKGYVWEQWAKHILDSQEAGGEELIQQAALTCDGIAQVHFRVLGSQRLQQTLTPLIVASIFGLVPVLELLAKRPETDLEQTGPWTNLGDARRQGSMALDLAVQVGDTAAVQVLLSLGTKCDATDYYGHKTMLVAASRPDGDTTILRLLLDNGTDPNATNRDGGTLLMHAAQMGPTEAVVLLLQHGIDINKADETGKTALALACSACRTQIVRVLLEKGADPTIADRNEITPLIDICSSSRSSMDARLEMVRLLLSRAAGHINVKDRWGSTALSTACRGCRRPIAQLLVEHGAIVDESTILAAIYGGSVEVLQLLLDAGASLQNFDGVKYAALHIAASENCVEMTRFLLRLGAVIDYPGYIIPTSTQHTITNSRLNGHFDFRKETPLTIALRNEYHKIVRILIENGAAVDTADKDGHTALHAAVERRDLDYVCVILDHGAAINRPAKNGRTPLMLAVCSESCNEMVKLLFSRGADSECTDEESWTISSLAARYHKRELVEILLSHGARLNHQDDKAISVLATALKNGQTNLARTLLEKGADHAGRSHDQRPALELATQNGYWRIMYLMLPLINDIRLVQSASNETTKEKPRGIRYALEHRITELRKREIWDRLFLSTRLLQTTGGYNMPTLTILGLRCKTHHWLSLRSYQPYDAVTTQPTDPETEKYHAVWSETSPHHPYKRISLQGPDWVPVTREMRLAETTMVSMPLLTNRD